MVEEADGRAGVAAGALRYAAARMFEDGVGDLAAAMDHLQLALDEPPAATFRPDPARAAPARDRGRQRLDGDRPPRRRDRGGDHGRRPRRPGRREGGAAGEPPGARGRGRGRCSRRRWRWSRATTGRCSPWRRARCARATTRGALLQTVLERRLAAAALRARSAAACSAGSRSLAEADPHRTAEALALWLRALDEDAGQGAAALARAGTRRVAAAAARTRALARAVGWRRRWPTGPARAAWLALAAALARHRLGADGAGGGALEEARAADPDDPALLIGGRPPITWRPDSGARRGRARSTTPSSPTIETGARRWPG